MNDHRREAYQRTFSKHGLSPKSLQWNSYISAAVRYKALVELTSPEDKTVLDAGCGMGDLLPYILAKGIPKDYLGIDITPEFVDIASGHYLGFDFKVADPFSNEFTDVFDIVYCCGVLNAKGDNWLERRKEMITKLFSITTDTLAFNMAGAVDPGAIPDSEKVAYAKAQDIYDFCQSLTPKVQLKTGYHPRDFTVVMQK